ncbi:MAG: 50S ribosomal protein L24 [Pseudomonadota bacterium]|jgi:large subunit ribosomal protein L24|nr:50S ribosomal protein L24 [Syntrophaceae bacterium]MDI9555314.1 50S ribosomal protein L24 [Pseudomonadota bacterium]NLX31805.1 50S ribosomal protein L24 [Deltaproteobacteria bacterium]HNU84354.1 50S ribosomal protein L24 [Syntrophales bacterium]HNZ34569.1 50S ribosomal protein L24 [Syntrophales bacterium]
MQTNRLKKGDTVKVIAGREKGKTGKITKILADGDKVVIEKLNLIKRHQRPDQKSKGGIMEKEAPLSASNVAPLCAKCDTGVRVGYRTLEDGKKVRFCRKCNEQLDQ